MTERQRTYEKGRQDQISDREQMRPNILENGEEGQNSLEPPICYLRKKVLQSILENNKYDDYDNGKKRKLDKNDVQKKYIGVMTEKGFFSEEEPMEKTDIIQGFNDAKHFQATSGYVNAGQIAVVALVLEINIMVWSIPAKSWTPFYAHFDEED